MNDLLLTVPTSEKLSEISNSPFRDTSLEVWVLIKSKLKNYIDPISYQTWIEPLTAYFNSSSEIIITVPSLVFYQTLSSEYLFFFDHVSAELNLNVNFKFEIIETSTSFEERSQTCSEVAAENSSFSKDESPERLFHAESTSNVPISKALTYHSNLNNEYSFSNFVNGSSNQFAHASCLAVADDPGQNYNPLFIYGSTGLGKTHLLHAVGNHVLKTCPNYTVTYVSSEQFINEMIYCLRFNKMWDFRKKYRSCDVLLVDDIQFISKKERTQEEFFHTFNTLYESKKQIVVTSDVFPQDIPDIEDRLRNRFQWGLIADIQPPDIEHRIAILLKKADQQGIPLSQDVAEYIAFQIKGSVRLLEGALKRVAAFASWHGSPLTTQLAMSAFQNVIGTTNKKLSLDHIQKVVADHFQLKVADLKSKKRHRAFSLPRQIAMFLCRKKTDSSFPEIGEKFGGKDHTTVMHAVKKIEHDVQKDLELKSHIETLERKLDI